VLRGFFRNTFFGISRAKREWINLHRLQRLGVPVPEPIAILESRRFRALRAGALATVWLDGSETLDRLLLRATPFETRRLAGEAARLAASMHSGGYTDGDLHPRNLLVKSGDAAGSMPSSMLKIDSPAGRMSRATGRRRHDLACLEIGGRRFMSRTERLRAWRSYVDALSGKAQIGAGREPAWLAAIRIRADSLEAKEGARIDAAIERDKAKSGRTGEGARPAGMERAGERESGETP
jgi:tRNA A-37 threonylcarbamoyl transferase component Bud32